MDASSIYLLYLPPFYLRFIIRSNLTCSSLQPQAHQGITGPSGSKSAHHMGAAACVVKRADWGVGEEVGGVG